ncbi:MAG: MATE family efflux transporter [Solobacterium sp.]|nr:MATE family efflux transporter [Solobacterium sp.]
MRKQNSDLLHGVIWKQLLLFFIPIMVGSIFQQLYNTVDAMVVGNFVGKQALGAVGGSTGTIINLLVGFTVGLSSGATVIIAQYYGRAEREGVRKGVYSGMFLAIALGSILMVLGLAFAPKVLYLLNVPDDVYSHSLTYLRIYLCGMVPLMIYNTGAGILRAVGDSRRPLYFLMAACIANIILDIIFVAGLGLGVAGVGMATVISQLLGCILTLYVLGTTDDIYHFSLLKLHFDREILKQIILIGLPTGIQASLYGFANLFIQAGVNSHGTDVVAAYTAFGKIDAIFWNSSGALGTAVLTFTGQNFGAGNLDRVKKGIREALAVYIFGAAFIGTICYAFGGFFFRLFTPDQAVIDNGLAMLRFLCPFWVTFCFTEIFSQSMRACGDTLAPMLMTAFGIGALRMIWILFYPGKTIFDTLLCYPVSWITTSLLFLGYYFQGGWRRRAMKQRERLMAMTQ